MIVVITGASSGIGRATAIEFARTGAKVVVAARREKELQEVITEIQAIGSNGIIFPMDVTDRDAMQALADNTVSHYGKIDVWVNNAAVTAFGRFEDIPEHVFRRVLEVNLFGYINGARAALSYFRRQNTGVLIDVSSVVGAIPQPYTLPYTVSKFAIKGFSEALRLELQDTGIEVCTVLPASIDTPLFQYGANYYGKKVKALNPVYPAKDVAEAIVNLAHNPKREITVGTSAVILESQHKLAPGTTEKIFSKQVEKDHFQDEPQEPTEGNLFTPIPGGQVSGGWRR
jgi:short-subunit dehydrogenase